ncbi:maleylpyruvate isomerase N-terminal domain-containing protein [Amycolatopsis sp. 195334CR]|uniref:maleylpyruvate isomerase N-terminal domain-containing protein n=1 Tax=Amycolatopsis sp. 195334CR TaxID=2814588 RepID=UPI001A8F8EE1|nr:maleylpyruvate isomerase N-terminal domain-containing protein [Amycolatopsis sp. 195334CR]MBN6041771.1 maleylpyruvate isomerase N-terminal domain-containing protein [Amycolatopsis sp. 195334CR]
MVGAEDVETAVGLALTTLAGAPAEKWENPAGTLAWTCWETAEHLADDLFAYAAQLGLRRPPVDRYVPFEMIRRRPEAPDGVVFADRSAGPSGLLQVLDSCGALLAAVVRTAPPTARCFHSLGTADAAGAAAMGVVETLVHTHDLAAGLGLTWTPPEDLCDRTLLRLFPDAPTDTPRWPTLLWATGRGDLPGHPRPTSWRWDSSIRA